MICHYPNCRQRAVTTPVVEVPTFRISEDGTVTATEVPTYLVGKEVCLDHQKTYALIDWMSESDWEAIREAARTKGFDVPSLQLVGIRFMPIGWTPQRGYLELERTH